MSADINSTNVAKAILDPVVTPPVAPVAPMTVTLVAALENLTGSSGADSFTGLVTSAVGSTLTAGDVIDGGAGVDTLTVNLAGTATAVLGGAKVSGIELLNIHNVGTGVATLDASTLPELTTLTSDRSSGAVSLSLLSQGTAVILKGDGATQLGGHQLAYDGKAQTVGIALDGSANAVKLGGLAVGGAELSSVTISSTGVANTVASLDLSSASKLASVTIQADGALSVTSLALPVAATALAIKGAGAVDIASVLSTVTSLDASTNTGGVTVALGGSTTLSFAGGTGNDVVKTGAVLVATASVDAGGGTDTLVVTDSTHLGASAAFYKGFEQVSVLNGVTANISTLAANITIGTIKITDGASATGVTGLTAAQAANIEILAANGTGAITIGLAVTTGSTDTVKMALNTAAGNAIDLTAVVLTGVENLELTGNGNGNLTLTTGQAQSLHTITITNAGVNNITLASGNKTGGLVIDASTSTGATTIDASAHSAGGLTLKGGSGGNVLLGTNSADTLIGGAGDD